MKKVYLSIFVLSLLAPNFALANSEKTERAKKIGILTAGGSGMAYGAGRLAKHMEKRALKTGNHPFIAKQFPWQRRALNTTSAMIIGFGSFTLYKVLTKPEDHTAVVNSKNFALKRETAHVSTGEVIPRPADLESYEENEEDPGYDRPESALTGQ